MPDRFPLLDSAGDGDLPGVKQHLTAGNVNQKGPAVSKAKHTRDVSKFQKKEILKKNRYIYKLGYGKREPPPPKTTWAHRALR